MKSHSQPFSTTTLARPKVLLTLLKLFRMKRLRRKIRLKTFRKCQVFLEKSPKRLAFGSETSKFRLRRVFHSIAMLQVWKISLTVQLTQIHLSALNRNKRLSNNPRKFKLQN